METFATNSEPPDDSRRKVAAVFIIAAACAFLLCGYELVRSVSSSVFIEAYGADHLSYVMAASPVGVVFMIYVYGCLLSRLGAGRALVATSLLSAVGFVGCHWGLDTGHKMAAGVLYVLREGYIVLIIEQYWSFINSTVSADQARRLNGPITGVASLGSICGGLLARQLSESMGSHALLLLVAGSLVPAAILSSLAYRIGGEPQPPPDESGGKQGQLALRLFFRSRYLLGIALLIWLTQMVSTVFDLRFNGLVEAAVPQMDARTAYFGGFYATLNAVAAVMQFVVAPLLLRCIALKHVHRGIPLVHIATAILLLVHPSLVTGATAYLLFKAFDYSVFRAAKEILYLPLSFDARYRSKQIIDSFGYRFSKGTTSGVIALATKVLGSLPVAAYPVVALGAAGGWLVVIGGLTRQHEEMARRDTDYR